MWKFLGEPLGHVFLILEESGAREKSVICIVQDMSSGTAEVPLNQPENKVNKNGEKDRNDNS